MPRFLRRSTTLERLVERGHGVVLRWWVHEVEVEVEEVLDAEVLEEEHDVGEVGALNLGDGGLHEFLAELAVGVESEVESWSSTPCASGALVCVGARYGCYVEAVHSEFGVEDFNFAVSAVEDIFDSIHGKTRLRHIRRNDILPNHLGRRLEYLRLQIRRQLRVHRQHQQRRRILPQLLHLLRQHGALLPRHKDEHVLRRTVEVQLYRLLDHRHDIILLHRFREVGFNGEGPSGYAKDRHAPEELAEHVRAERRAGDDEPTVPPSSSLFFSSGSGSLPPRFSTAPAAISSATRLATLIARHPPGLGAPDQHPVTALSRLEEVLGELSDLTGSGLPYDDDDVVLAHDGQQLVADGECGEVGPLLEYRTRACELGRGAWFGGGVLYVREETGGLAIVDLSPIVLLVLHVILVPVPVPVLVFVFVFVPFPPSDDIAHPGPPQLPELLP